MLTRGETPHVSAGGGSPTPYGWFFRSSTGTDITQWKTAVATSDALYVVWNWNYNPIYINIAKFSLSGTLLATTTLSPSVALYGLILCYNSSNNPVLVLAASSTTTWFLTLSSSTLAIISQYSLNSPFAGSNGNVNMKQRFFDKTTHTITFIRNVSNTGFEEVVSVNLDTLTIEFQKKFPINDRAGTGQSPSVCRYGDTIYYHKYELKTGVYYVYFGAISVSGGTVTWHKDFTGNPFVLGSSQGDISITISETGDYLLMTTSHMASSTNFTVIMNLSTSGSYIAGKQVNIINGGGAYEETWISTPITFSDRIMLGLQNNENFDSAMYSGTLSLNLSDLSFKEYQAWQSNLQSSPCYLTKVNDATFLFGIYAGVQSAHCQKYDFPTVNVNSGTFVLATKNTSTPAQLCQSVTSLSTPTINTRTSPTLTALTYSISSSSTFGQGSSPLAGTTYTW